MATIVSYRLLWQRRRAREEVRRWTRVCQEYGAEAPDAAVRLQKALEELYALDAELRCQAAGVVSVRLLD